MKEKRTYTHLKEHGEDMTHENEFKIDVPEDRGPLDLTRQLMNLDSTIKAYEFLIECFKKRRYLNLKKFI